MVRIKANNHAGWDVQWLSEEGWINFYNFVFESLEEAYRTTARLAELNPEVEYRAYEALYMKEQA